MNEKPRRLLDFANCSGCAGKLAPMNMAAILRDLPARSTDPNLLVGTETSDDAGIYMLPDGLALVQTLDFFPPLVDDPYIYGQIAATNALSDVYAMNGRPLTAMNIVGFPDTELPLSILAEILKGAASKVSEAGAVTLGGHSVRDTEVKFGLSVTGIVDPKDLLTNANSLVGDLLVLTKPLGTGFVCTANKKGECSEHLLGLAVESMTSLNSRGRDAVRTTPNVNAMTDVTGFGLAGHASEMADGAIVTIRLQTSQFPRFAGIEALLDPRHHSRATKSNREFLAGRMVISDGTQPEGLELAFDPQTSGGLLIAVSPGSLETLIESLKREGALAWALVGQVEERQGDTAIILE